jgi:hypothetical protein
MVMENLQIEGCFSQLMTTHHTLVPTYILRVNKWVLEYPLIVVSLKMELGRTDWQPRQNQRNCNYNRI